MDHISGLRGYASSARWRRLGLTKRGQKALSLIKPVPHGDDMVNAHNDSEALRHMADRFRRRARSFTESSVQFDLDRSSGDVFLTIFDEEKGQVAMTLSADQVAEGLKRLEETTDNAAPLSSFFIDVEV